MNDTTLDSPSAIKTFLGAVDNIELSISKKQRYSWVAQVLKQTDYFSLEKKEKSVVREYMIKASHFSRAQLTRLIKQYRTQRWIGKIGA